MANKTNETKLYWGYGRASKDEQVESPARQADMIRDRFAAVKANHPEADLMPVVEEHESATAKSWKERPKLRWLLGQIRRGDTLLIWRMDRIDRSSFRQIEFLSWCLEQGIGLIVLHHGGEELDLSSTRGRTMALMDAMFAEMWLENHRQAIRSGLAWRRSQGLPASRTIPWGHRRVYRWDAARNKRSPAADVPCPRECRKIAELVFLRRAGYSWQTVCRLAAEAKLRRSPGRDEHGLVVRKGARFAMYAGERAGKKDKFPTLNDHNVRGAVCWAERQLDLTGTILGTALPESTASLRWLRAALSAHLNGVEAVVFG